MLVESRGHLLLDTEGLTCPFFLFFSFFEGKTKQKQTNATKQFKWLHYISDYLKISTVHTSIRMILIYFRFTCWKVIHCWAKSLFGVMRLIPEPDANILQMILSSQEKRNVLIHTQEKNSFSFSVRGPRFARCSATQC